MNTIRGLTLIEVLVTVVITSIGLMGLVSLQMQSLRATQDTGNRSHAVWVFNDIVNRVRANEAFSASYNKNGNAVNCAQPPANICSHYNPGAAAAVPAENCDGQQLAAWDLFEIACGAPRNVGVLGNAVTYMPDVQLFIDCAAPCNDGDALTVTLRWRAKQDTAEITGADRDANSNFLTIQETFTP